jgi:hypothetical protein
VATAVGDTFSVVSGGLACVAGALVLTWLLPGFRRQDASSDGTAVHDENVSAAT